jgi:hypothetical protein
MKTNAPHSQPSLSATASPRRAADDSLQRTLPIESGGRGVLDRPVKPDDDRFGRLKIEVGVCAKRSLSSPREMHSSCPAIAVCFAQTA